MAQEITATCGLTVNKTNGPVFTMSSSSQRIDLSGSRYSGGIQDIGTSAHEALTIISDQSTSGWSYFKNLDATNYLEIGRDVAAAFSPVLRLNAGEVCVCRVTTTALYAKANTGACKLQYMILEP